MNLEGFDRVSECKRFERGRSRGLTRYHEIRYFCKRRDAACAEAGWYFGWTGVS